MELKAFHANLLPRDLRWDLDTNPLVKQSLQGQTVVTEFSGKDTNYYQARVTPAAMSRTVYRVTGEIETVGLKAGRGAGFQVGDARGRAAALSAEMAGDGRESAFPFFVNPFLLASEGNNFFNVQKGETQ